MDARIIYILNAAPLRYLKCVTEAKMLHLCVWPVRVLMINPETHCLEPSG